MAISGYPGLYRFISQGRNAIIVESLEDKRRMSVYSTSKISTLEEIAVFTDSGEMPLADVFKRMYEHSGGSGVISHKSANQEIKRFFEEVMPEYDSDRVYVSDMKKIINWYNLLLNYGLLKPAPEETDDTGSGSGETGSSGPDSEDTFAERPADGNETGTKKKGNGGNSKEDDGEERKQGDSDKDN